MKLKATFLLGAAVGYVLGTRAGRDRYEALKKQADSVWHDPRVQQKVSAAGEAVKEKAPEVKERFSAAAGDAAQAAKAKAGEAKDKVSDARGGSSDDGGALIGEESTSDYTPHETKVQNS